MLVLLIIYFILVSNCLATNKIKHYNEYVSSQLNINTNINNIIAKLDNLAKNMCINKEGIEYYKNRNSIQSFVNNINKYILAPDGTVKCHS